MIQKEDIAKLENIRTHSAAWVRALQARANRPGTPEGLFRALQASASEISGAAKSFRWRAAQEGTDPLDLLRVADRALRQVPFLRQTLMSERDIALTEDRDDAGWFTHEVNVLDRLLQARNALIVPPEKGETPLSELGAICQLSSLLGREIEVQFDGTGEEERGPILLVSPLRADWEPPLSTEIEQEIRDRLNALADLLIRCEIPNWDEEPGASGRILVGPEPAPWIDAVDHGEDWLLERHIDTDTLPDRFPGEQGRDLSREQEDLPQP